MSKLESTKDEIDFCFQALHLLSQNNRVSQSINDSFTRFPNGFYINDTIDANQFLISTIKEPSTKDKISKFLTLFTLIKKLGTSSFEIAFESSISDKNEKISAFKLINETLIVWTEKSVYKIPLSDKSLKRIEMTQENLDIIKKLDIDIQNLFLIPTFINVSDTIIQFSTKYQMLSPDKKSISKIDEFLSCYFEKIFKNATKQDSISRGFQHSDLHFRNILKDDNNQLFITDLDLIKENGFPFLDIMHFSIHLIRTLEQTTQYKPFELFLEEKTFLYNKLRNHNFSKLSEIWLKYYHDDYISLYIQNQIEWYHYNKVFSDELIQLEQLRKKYNI